jgi:CPA2 family monovalent cation:H+ antiporter-2
MLVDPHFVYNNISTISILVLLVAAGKFIIFYFLGIIFKYSNIIPLAMGLGLSQVGEFSFVLARTGLKNNVITNDFYSLVLSVSIVTILISPFLSLLAAPVYSLKRRWFRHEQILTVNLPDGGLKDHVIIAGGGRVGFQIASILHKLDFPFIIIEQDFRRFERSKNSGFPIIYGDAGQETVLAGSKIEAARLIIITIPRITTARNIIAIAKLNNKNINLIVRADDLSQVDELFKMNIFEVVQPEFEASLEIIRQALIHLDVPLTAIYGFTDKIRRENFYALRPGNLQQLQLSYFKDAPFLLEMSWVEISKDSVICGKSINEMKIRTKTGVSVVGILRKSEFIPNPDVIFIFQPGDYIAIIGIPENKKLFINSMLSSRIIS